MSHQLQAPVFSNGVTMANFKFTAPHAPHFILTRILPSLTHCAACAVCRRLDDRTIGRPDVWATDDWAKDDSATGRLGDKNRRLGDKGKDHRATTINIV